MKKEKIAIIIIAVLVVALALALYLNKDIIAENQTTFDNVEINILNDGEEVTTLSYNDLIAIGAEEFESTYDTSTTDPVVETYKGVELKKIFESLGISTDDKSSVVLTAVDNYAIAYTMEEVLIDGNVYVTYECEGEALLSKDDGGQGPLEVIITSDSFSNRRCKWLISIEIKS